MYGAILGDIIGSPFEFDRGNRSKFFDLFTAGCTFTDDSVMTIAVGEALMDAGPDADAEAIRNLVIVRMQDWGRRYPYAGYGGRFIDWIWKDDPRPYGSWGNGSAMRVSAAGWLYDSVERTREVAVATAEVTHNHPEGIKGAQATAAAIWMARNGKTREEIRDYIEKTYGYDLHKTWEYWHPIYHWEDSCQGTVPQAIICFLDSTDFEDAIRKAVSLGGDSDTLACITGGIAEAYYKEIPGHIAKRVRAPFPRIFNKILDEMRSRTVYGSICCIR